MSKKITINTSTDSILSELQQKGKNHIVTFTNMTTKVETENSIYVINPERVINKSIFIVMNKIASLINKTKIPDDYRGNIKYNLFNETNIDNKIKENQIVEIDIVSAYFNAAINLGYLSAENVNEICELSEKCKLTTKEFKKAKLMALGSMATRKEIFEFENGKYVERDLIIKETENIFFHVAFEIDLLMKDIASKFKEHFFFYWVDALFVSAVAEKEIINYINEKGYICTIKKIQNVYIQKNAVGSNVFITQIVKELPFETHIKIKNFFYKSISKTREQIRKLHYNEVNKYLNYKKNYNGKKFKN